MLVLSRKQSESVTIADVVEVTILKIQGNRVRLGIKAPKGIPIQRNEIIEADAQVADAEPEPEPVA